LHLYTLGDVVKLTRCASIALSAAALLAAGGLAAGLPSAANAAAGQKAAPHAAQSVAVYDCGNQPQVRPSSFDVSCDGSFALGHLKWTTWTIPMATATGVEYVDNCTPNCASGKWSRQNAEVIFWRSLPVAHRSGKFGYSKMTLLLPNQRGGSTYTQAPPGVFPGEF
jgi:hypothetical protein